MKNKNYILENFIKILYMLSACISVLMLFIICYFLFKNGVKPIFEIGFKEFIFGKKWLPSSEYFGIFPMIISSIYLTALSSIIGIILGILTAIYLVYYCNKKYLKIYERAIDLLASIPSVIYGFFGMMVIVPIIRIFTGGSGKNILSASILLAIMILPTIISITQSSLKQVPNNYLEGSLALGATYERSIFLVVLPAAKSGIYASIMLGMGRAIGETMAVIMVMGNQVVMPNIFKGARSLTANIVLELGYATDMHREALIGTSVVLFIFILIINLVFTFINGGKNEK